MGVHIRVGERDGVERTIIDLVMTHLHVKFGSNRFISVGQGFLTCGPWKNFKESLT